MQQCRQAVAGPSTSALDGALRNAEQAGGVGHGVAVHVHGEYRGPLPDGQPQQSLMHDDGSLNPRVGVGYRVILVQWDGTGPDRGASKLVGARIEDDPVQPTADG